MNRKGKSWPLFVVAILIVLFSLTAILGVSYTYGDTKNVYVKGASDIRFGIDIRGGVDVTFMPADDVEATDAQMTAAKTVIEDRLVGLGITDYESYVDNNKNRIIVRFPWKSDEADFPRRFYGAVTHLPFYFTFCTLDNGPRKPHNNY